MESLSKHPDKFYAGQIHYCRIPVEYWQHRILMIKAMGLNCLSVYVMWNHHEIEPGVFDFKTDNRDLPGFLDLAMKHNMLVLFRPGPYVCAQWDFGGHPAWLLRSKTFFNIRTNTQLYMTPVRSYFRAISPIIIKYDKKNGGPIFLLQIQNQYGFFSDDMSYINQLRSIWLELGVTTEQYHADPPCCIHKSHWKGGIIGVNNGNSKDDYELARKLDPDVFVFGGEIYTGWMTHWGEPWAEKTIDHQTNLFGFLLGNEYSFSMYMIHGGTNFGFTAGANGRKKQQSDYWGMVTSYDYDAPINEQGSPNSKFFALRHLFSKYVNYQIPDVPSPLKTIKIPPFLPTPYASLTQNLPEPITLPYPSHFESDELRMYHQGIVVYEFELPAGYHECSIKVHDYGILFVNGRFVCEYDRHKTSWHQIKLQLKEKSRIRILVEAMGHINFDKDMNNDRKGLVEFVESKKQTTISNWNHYKVPLTFESLANFRTLKQNSYPQFLKHKFDLEEIGDTYLNLKDYVKGYVWVNGRNLGRFWNKGPQFKLFCPGVWLKNEGNQIIILELGDSKVKPISGDKTLKEFDV